MLYIFQTIHSQISMSIFNRCPLDDWLTSWCQMIFLLTPGGSVSSSGPSLAAFEASPRSPRAVWVLGIGAAEISSSPSTFGSTTLQFAKSSRFWKAKSTILMDRNGPFSIANSKRVPVSTRIWWYLVMKSCASWWMVYLIIGFKPSFWWCRVSSIHRIWRW